MTIPAELAAPVLAFLRCYGFLLAFSALRQQLGAPVVVSAAVALAAGAARDATNGILLGAAISGASIIQSGACELLAGFILGLPFSLAAQMLASSGRLLDLLRGNLVAEQILPGLEERASPFEAAVTLGVTALAFSSGLWRLPIGVLYRSFADAPSAYIDGLSSQAGTSALFRFVEFCFRENVFILAPVLASMFAWDIAVAALARAVPRVHIAGELAGAKLIFGVVALLLVNWPGPWAAGIWQTAAETAGGLGAPPGN